MEGGTRFRPFDGLPIQPFLDLGFQIGWTALQISGSAREPLSTQGDDFKLRDDMFSYGLYYGGGVEWNFASIAGVSLYYRRNEIHTTTSKLLRSKLRYDSDMLLTAAYFRW